MSELRDVIAAEVRRHYADTLPAFEALVARRRRRRTVRTAVAGVLVVGVAVLAGVLITSDLQVLPRDGDPAELAVYSGGRALVQLNGRDCGRIDFDLTDPNSEPGTEEVRCMLDAFRSGAAAYLIMQVPTVEGDPIRTVYQVVDKGLVDVVYDTTEDSYGARVITQRQCRSLQREDNGYFEELVYDRCERSPSSPLIKLSDEGYSSCGRFEVDLERRDHRRGAEKVECLLDALSTGRSTVLTVHFRTDEGDTIRAFYKVVGVRRVDILYDTTDDRFGSRSITLRQCRSLAAGEPLLEHGECGPSAGP